MNLVETINILQRDVLSYKYDNESLMKSKEHKMASTLGCCRVWTKQRRRWGRGETQASQRATNIMIK